MENARAALELMQNTWWPDRNSHSNVDPWILSSGHTANAEAARLLVVFLESIEKLSTFLAAQVVAGADGVQDMEVDEARGKAAAAACKRSFEAFVEDEVQNLGYSRRALQVFSERWLEHTLWKDQQTSQSFHHLRTPPPAPSLPLPSQSVFWALQKKHMAGPHMQARAQRWCQKKEWAAHFQAAPASGQHDAANRCGLRFGRPQHMASSILEGSDEASNNTCALRRIIYYSNDVDVVRRTHTNLDMLQEHKRRRFLECRRIFWILDWIRETVSSD